MISTEAIAKKIRGGDYEKITIQRGWTSEEDVELEVKYSGFCHTDLHIANNDLGITSYPVVPGHEVAGVVTKVGSKVHDLKAGDHVGIGYFIDSCLSCEYCAKDDETNCLKGKTMTAAGAIRFGRIMTDNGKYSYGGFSKKMIANRHFISKIPKSYPLEKAGPCFCAGDHDYILAWSHFIHCRWLLGVTMYGPLKEYGATQGGKNVGIAGFGGLGQMGNHTNFPPRATRVQEFKTSKNFKNVSSV